MLIIFPVLLICLSGSAGDVKNRIVHIPYAEATTNEDGYLKKDVPYCLSFTWLGNSFENATFSSVANKTCSEFFDKKNPVLCVDPMAVTFSGKEPDIAYVLKHHAKIATCKMSEGKVCAKYTTYYNGKMSHVVRYCTKIDIESEGQMKSGCLTEYKGADSYEICACLSGHGPDGICNSAPHLAVTDVFVLISLSCLCRTWFLLRR